MPTVHDWGEDEDLSAKHEQQLSCSHTWAANSGRGGTPEYRPNRAMSPVPLMHVQCEKCGVRTWFSEVQWERLVHPTRAEGG